MILTKKRNAIEKIEPFELYNDCSELPLYRWIKLAVTGDYKWLIKTGKTKDDLADHYHKVYTEYTSLVKDVRSTQELKLKIAVSTTAKRIDHIQICVNLLRVKRDEKLIHLLQNELGFSRLTYIDLDKDLTLTETLMRSEIVKYEQKRIQLEKMFTDMADGDNGELEFYEQIRILAKWLTFNIDPHTTSVIQYISYLNALKLEIKNNQNA